MNVLDSVDKNTLKSIKAEELRTELAFRMLPSNGAKDELVDMLLIDNERVIADGIQKNLIAAREKRHEDSKKIEELQKKVSTLQLSQGTSPVDTNLLSLLHQFSESQKLIAEKLSSSTSQQVQIFSTNDTASAISSFSGKKTENVGNWLKEVDRIAAHAHWTPSLTLVNASSRLTGSAMNWHKVSGRSIENWNKWKEGITDRFKLKMNFSDFIQFQAKRVLRFNESITEYIYDKDAIIDNSPFPLEQSDRVSLILQGINDQAWSIPLATAMCKSVQDLVDHAAQLDTIRKCHTNIVSTSNNFKSFDKSKEQNKFIRRFNPSVDKEEEQTCFRCKSVGHVSYNCKVQLPEKTSPKNIYQNARGGLQNKDTKNKDITNTKSINCVQKDYCSSDLVKVSQIPVTINGNITIDALPDNGSCVTLLRKCFAPANSIVFPWQDGSYVTPSGNCTPSGWISLRIQVGAIDYVMPKVGLCENLPIAMILGRDWQMAVHATITIEPNGAVCISTPTEIREFGCVKTNQSFVGCVVQSRFSSSPLVAQALNTVPARTEEKQSKDNKESFLSEEQTEELKSLLCSYQDIFSTPEAELGDFPNLEMEINLTNEKPIKCKPYRASEPDKDFMRTQVEKWIKLGVCRLSTSPYGAPAFVVDQPFHDSTPKRLVVDYSRTINSITVKDPFPIDQMDIMINKIAGKKYKTLVDVRHAFNNFRIREQDIFKTAAVTPEHHVEFCRVIFGLANAPALLARAISTAYGHLLDSGLAKYYDDLAAGHNSFDDHMKFLKQLFEATRKFNLKLTKNKCSFAVQEVKILGRILDETGERPIPETPFEIISADHLSLPTTKAGNCYILAHICHATRYILARPTCTTATNDVIHTLENDIINHYGPPVVYISDNGSSFTSSKFRLYLEKFGIRHALCPPYTPQANGLIERANATMISVLSKFSLEFPDDWDLKLPNLVLAINTAQQSTTKFSPFYLLHGYEPKISLLDMLFESLQSHIGRLNQIDLLAQARNIAKENIKIKHNENKKRFDEHRSHHQFSPGQLVWYNWSSSNDNKLSPGFKGPFIIQQPVGKVCYRINKPNATNDKYSRIVHVQDLKPFHDRPNLDDPGEASFFNILDENTNNPQSPEVEAEIQNSKPTRKRRPPIWFNDYV